MNDTHHFFAFDLGATSGRSILGTLSGDQMELKELNRFPNRLLEDNGKFHWDIYALFEALKDGLKKASALNIHLDGIGIDTWGVDFVYLGSDGSILEQPRAYRDPYTIGKPEEFFQHIPQKELYELTGIQIMNFNSLFQLYAAGKENPSVLNKATDILFMPDALSYLLTGKKICEYTIASTSQLLNPRTHTFIPSLFEALNLSPSLMQDISLPGEIIGNVQESVAKECGLDKTAVIAVAGHDTGSAIVAVPAENEKFAYLSSGTWSLMGIEVDQPILTEESYAINFTNEGGINGTTRYLKNITGMWLLEQCLKEWSVGGKTYDYPQITAMTEAEESFRFLIDPDDVGFANPESMTSAIIDYCRKTNQCPPVSDAEFTRCIFDSLALKYRYVLELLKKSAPFPIEKLHVIGGGSKNNLLNQATANAIGLPVVAGPAEATAMGNILVQAKSVGLLNSLQDMRNLVRHTIQTEQFLPKDSQHWNQAYQRFVQILH